MDFQSYLYADAGQAPIPASLYDEWRWLVPDRFRPVRVNLFGDALFLDAESGHLLELDVLAGEVIPLAVDHDAAREFLDDPRAFAIFARFDLVEQARVQGLAPGPGEMYCLIRPLHLGGDLVVDNLEVAHAAVNLAMAAVAKQASREGGDRGAGPAPGGFWSRLWRRATRSPGR